MNTRKKNKNLQKLIFGFSFLLLFSACKKEEPKHEDEIGHEHVATLILHFEGNENGQKKTVRFDAPEISGTPLVTPIEGLPAGEYKVSVEFRGRADNDITDEFFVRLKEEHFVYYDPLGTNDTRPFIRYADDDVKDSAGIKLGKRTIWTLQTGESGMIIHLRHHPSLKDPNAPNASALGGHDDIKAEFQILVK